MLGHPILYMMGHLQGSYNLIRVIFYRLFLFIQVNLTLIAVVIVMAYGSFFYMTTSSFRHGLEQYIYEKYETPIEIKSIGVVDHAGKTYWHLTGFRSPHLDIKSVYVPFFPDLGFKISTGKFFLPHIKGYSVFFPTIVIDGVEMDLSDKASKKFTFLEKCLISIASARGSLTLTDHSIALGNWMISGPGGAAEIVFPEYSPGKKYPPVEMTFADVDLSSYQPWFKKAILSGSVSGRLSLYGLDQALSGDVSSWEFTGEVNGDNLVYGGSLSPSSKLPVRIDDFSSFISLGPSHFKFSNFEAHAYKGAISGAGEMVPFSPGASRVSSTIKVRGIDAGPFFAACHPGSPLFGALDFDFKFDLIHDKKGITSPRASGSFSASNGYIAGVEFKDGAQYVVKDSSIKFDKLSGNAEIFPDHREYNDLQLKASGYSASGTVVATGEDLSGTVGLSPLKIPAIKLVVSGTRESPILVPAPSSLLGAVVGGSVGGPIGAAIGVSAGGIIGDIVDAVVGKKSKVEKKYPPKEKGAATKNLK